MNLFGKFFSSLFGTGPDPDMECPGDSKLELEQAWDEVQALAQKQIKLQSSETRKEAPQDKLLKQHKIAQEALWKDILQQHQKLGTELDKETLLRLRRLALGHAFGAEEPFEASLEERIDYFVMRDLFQRCAIRAWERLERLMQGAKESWPIPPTLNYHRSPESVAELVIRRQHAQREEFISGSLHKQVDLVIGEVKVWGPTYPASDSWLWKQTALYAVGAGLHLQLFAAALELWLWRSSSLEDALRARIKGELVTVKALLGRGVVTLEEADNVASRARNVCSQIIPTLVWESLESRLNCEGALPDLATLAKEVSTVDPVCDMALTSERIIARTTHAGKTYYFCSESCKKRFLASPKNYIGDPN